MGTPEVVLSEIFQRNPGDRLLLMAFGMAGQGPVRVRGTPTLRGRSRI